jgi:hypothetical protein
MTSPDFDRTWTGQAAEFGQVRRIPLEVRRTVCWVRRNWLGPVKVRRNPSEKGGECKVHQLIDLNLLQDQLISKWVDTNLEI